MIVTIDNREKERAKRGLQYYTSMGYETSIVERTYGDFGFSDNGIEVVVEYKTIADFINSIQDKRVFNQALNQSNHYDYHFVVIVGNEKDYAKAKREHYFHTGHSIANEDLNGAIASLVNFTSVLQVKTEPLAFDLMERIGLKCTRDKPIIHRYNKSRGSPAYRLLVHTVNRLGEKTASRICDELSLDSADSVFKITKKDLLSVDGIGVKRADNILSQLKSEYS